MTDRHICALYADDGWSIPSIAAHTGLSAGRVRNILIAGGVKIRSQSEAAKLKNCIRMYGTCIPLSDYILHRGYRERVVIRPGNHVIWTSPNPKFKGRHYQEYGWFYLTGRMPTKDEKIVSGCGYLSCILHLHDKNKENIEHA